RYGHPRLQIRTSNPGSNNLSTKPQVRENFFSVFRRGCPVRGELRVEEFQLVLFSLNAAVEAMRKKFLEDLANDRALREAHIYEISSCQFGVHVGKLFDVELGHSSQCRTRRRK